MSGKLTRGFRDIIELRWSEFIKIERSLAATNSDSVVTGIARACKKGNLRAIQTALDRLDGKVAMEIEVEYPKFYTVYPYATKRIDDPTIIEADENGIIKLITDIDTIDVDEIIDVNGSPSNLNELEDGIPTGSLREMLDKILKSPKYIVADILAGAEAVEGGRKDLGDPMVKSVIVAGLMKLVHDGRVSAVFETFDQIDGKVADKIKILGNDVFLTRFDQIAPAGAEKNTDVDSPHFDMYQLAAVDTTNFWATRLEQGRLRR